ncbi:MAG: SRPBCC family protein [Pararhodobacter sp.]|nr:SRPBCC family protein [Pararhodobacter sp.]
MKINANAEFDAPREAVFARFAEPERMRALIEDAGGRVDAVIAAEGAPPSPAMAGTAWQGGIAWRGAARAFTVTLAEAQPSRLLRYQIESPQMKASLDFDFVERAGGVTMVSAQLRPRPEGVLGRMAVQALRLMHDKAKARLMRAMALLGRVR